MLGELCIAERGYIWKIISALGLIFFFVVLLFVGFVILYFEIKKSDLAIY